MPFIPLFGMPPKAEENYFAAKFAASLAKQKVPSEATPSQWFHILMPDSDVGDTGRFIRRAVARAAEHDGAPLPTPPPGMAPRLSDEEANEAADALAAGYTAEGIHHLYDSIKNVRALILRIFMS